MKKFFPFLFLLLITACASSAKYEHFLNSWLGMTELEFIRQWGPPKQTYEANGSKFLVYQYQNTRYYPGSVGYVGGGYWGYPGYYGATSVGDVVQLNCETWFELMNGKITSWRWKGNDCEPSDFQSHAGPVTQ